MDAVQQLDPDIYDDEAFVGIEEGEVMDGRVVDDLNEEGASIASHAPDSHSIVASGARD